jgi:L-ascorbate metabolism protein UlaG (beta-lactamase superfamily)
MRAARLAIAILILLSARLYGAESFDEKDWRTRADGADPSLLYAPHFKNGEYFNPWLPVENRGFGTYLRWRIFGKKADYSKEEREFLPAVIPGAAARVQSLKGRNYILWVGHSTFLVALDGEYWLTDPVFSDRVIIPRRVTPPAVTAGDLAAMHGRLNVLISHNHYDHLDVDSIKRLPPSTRFFVPMGLGSLIRGAHRGKVVEMDWWQGIECGKGARVICLPMQHWSKRITQGTNTTLWASFLVVGRKTKVYYAGDSGYFVGYREIGRRYPGIDYVLMPTTAYHPRWFMHYAHMNVAEALDAFEQLGARYFIPTQWGTFQLGEEPPGYAGLDLRRRILERGLDASRYLIMDIGQAVEIPGR